VNKPHELIEQDQYSQNAKAGQVDEARPGCSTSRHVRAESEPSTILARSEHWGFSMACAVRLAASAPRFRRSALASAL
jgi:hypothetical protein